MKDFDTFVLGQVCVDVNTDFGGQPVREPGGAVFYSGFAAAAMGHRVAVLPKANPNDVNPVDIFSKNPHIKVFAVQSKQSTFIRNVYLTADRERRESWVDSQIEPYRPDDVPAVDASIYHLAGLMRGDLGHDMIRLAASRAMTALDVQCILRVVKDGQMVFEDWAEKKKYLPLIRFLKTDALEAEILTGLTDTEAAARLLFQWGAKEVMITHNTEVLVFDGNKIYRQPLKPRNLSGRTGRGDTCFSGYITERLTKEIPQSLRTAAALVSLKMETPGPFMGNREDVEKYAAIFFNC
ncbi:MAG: ribokinase [Clostridiales bacterium]|nr:ribokinase [Clostridiales bacterium]